MYEAGWFRRTGDAFDPLPLARSLWSPEQIHGVAVSGLLALTLEQTLAGLGRAGLVPARYHVDLFRAAHMTTTTVSATVVREGPRLALLDAIVEQAEDDEAFLRLTDERWNPLLATGETVSWDDARSWIEARARAERPERPSARDSR